MPATPKKAASRRLIVTAAALMVAALVLAVFAAAGTVGKSAPAGSTGSGGGPGASAGSGVPSDAQGPDLARRKDGDPFALGRVDAPVVMIEYSDFQCPFCGRFARETKPELIRKYVDSGVLRIEWRNFPVFGAESTAAAHAGYAAARQGRFWQFHDLLYAETHRRNAEEFAEKKLLAWAREAGVPDMKRFQQDMNGAEAKRVVGADEKEGYEIGVTSTPAFLVNDRPILGAQPTEVFTRTIEEARR